MKTNYYVSPKNKPQPSNYQRQQNLNPDELFGLWKQPRNLTDIRKQAWQRLESES